VQNATEVMRSPCVFRINRNNQFLKICVFLDRNKTSAALHCRFLLYIIRLLLFYIIFTAIKINTNFPAYKKEFILFYKNNKS